MAGSGFWNRREWISGAAASAAALPLSAQTSASTLEQRLALPGGKVQAVVDSDTYNEIDDQFAVSYAMLSPERMEIEAIYAAPFHNERSNSARDGMEKSYEEILRILGRLGKPSVGFAHKGSDRFMEGPTKPVESPAARDLIRKALEPRTGPLYVITIGAPTNVSSALLMEPRILNRIVVVWLGGQPFDFPTAREFNLYQDIHASRVLYDSGVALVDVPTRNVSEHLRTTVPEVNAHLRGKSSIADYLASEYEKFTNERLPNPEFPLSRVIWDISTVAWLVNPSWVPSSVVPSPVLTDDFKYKREAGRHPVRVATYVDRDRVFNDLFRKLAAART